MKTLKFDNEGKQELFIGIRIDWMTILLIVLKVVTIVGNEKWEMLSIVYVGVNHEFDTSLNTEILFQKCGWSLG